MNVVARSLVVIATALGLTACASSPAYQFRSEFAVSTAPGAAAPGVSGNWMRATIAQMGANGVVEAIAPRAEFEATGVAKDWYALLPGATNPLAARRDANPPLNPWDVAHAILEGRAPAEYADLLESAGIGRDVIIELEPNVAYYDEAYGKRREAESRRQSAPQPCATLAPDEVVACGDPSSFHWPNVKRVDWHQEGSYTQIAAARKRAAGSFGGPDVVAIAHLDTGYYKTNDTITPPNFDFAASHSLIPDDPCGPSGIDCFYSSFLANNGHGPSTLSILAGGHIKFAGAGGYPAYDDYLGVAPLARVFTYRVSNSVVLFYPMYAAQGIFEASKNGADVVSMSMGGAPSFLLRDAVNHAYDSGTAMFFAAGDFYHLPIPLIDIDIPWHTQVHPARFSRTAPISGVTALGRSYGLNPGWLSLLRGDCAAWMLRGSYGPTHLMRGRALTAYSPNISRRNATADPYPANQINFDFAGTSAATPETAGSAALWLQFHRGDFTPADWRSWQKSEAVYQALQRSASCPDDCTPYFGAGIVQADHALDVKRPSDLHNQKEARIGVNWITILAAILGINPDDPPPPLGSQRYLQHARMLQLEVAQLVSSSQELRAIVGEDLGSQPEGATVARLAAEIQRDRRASTYLKRCLAAKGR